VVEVLIEARDPKQRDHSWTAASTWSNVRGAGGRLLRSCRSSPCGDQPRTLGVPGELIWRTPSLSLPSVGTRPGTDAQSEAVRLFVERARAEPSSFEMSNRHQPRLWHRSLRLEGFRWRWNWPRASHES